MSKGNHKIAITSEELTWLQRMVPRHAKHLKIKREARDRQTSGRLVAASESLVAKMMTPVFVDEQLPGGLIAINTNRQDLRILEQIVKAENDMLIKVLIPGYAEKMTIDNKYRAYYDSSIERSKMTAALFNKIKARL